MNKTLYIQKNRPALFAYRVECGNRRRNGQTIEMREARYSEKMGFLEQVMAEIKEERKKIWDTEDHISKFNLVIDPVTGEETRVSFEDEAPRRAANARKTDARGVKGKSFAAFGYSSHASIDEPVALKFPTDTVRREVEVKIED